MDLTSAAYNVSPLIVPTAVASAAALTPTNNALNNGNSSNSNNHATSATGASNGSTPNGGEGAAFGAQQLRWHSRSESNSSKDGGNDQQVAPRFEVPRSTEGPRYQLSHGLQQTASEKRYVVVMVGLPARGKTFIAQKLARILAWLGHGAVVHNLQAAYRASLQPPRRLQLSDFDFRDDGSDTFSCYMRALDNVGEQVREFFSKGGLVAFVNDDFVSKRVREEIERRVGCHAHETIYVEITRDAEINIQNDLEKILNPREFGHVGSEAALTEARDKFYERVQLLRAQYTPVKETARSYIQLHNSVHLQAFNVRGYLPSRLTSVLLNLGTQKQRYPIYFSRHGESTYNLEDRIGGDPPLSEKGMRDAQHLRDFVGLLVQDYQRRKSLAAQHQQQQSSNSNKIIHDEPPLQIWSSELLRTLQTSQPAVDAFGLERRTWHNLNEIHAGVCEDMTYSDVKEKYPSIDYFRAQAKYSFRYPQGESYQDIVQRLEPLILELENADREVLVVAHQAILRCLLSYFGHKSAESSVYQEVAHRTIWRCTYNADGISSLDELKLPLDVDTLMQASIPTSSSGVALDSGAQSPVLHGETATVAAAAAASNKMALTHSGMLGSGGGTDSVGSGSSGIDVALPSPASSLSSPATPQKK